MKAEHRSATPWQRFLAWIGPAADDSNSPRPGWYRYGPTLLVTAILILDLSLENVRPLPAAGVIASLATALLLLERRRWPLAVFGAALAIDLSLVGLSLAFGWPTQATIAGAIAQRWLLYNTTRWAPKARYHLAVGLIGLTAIYTIVSALALLARADNEFGFAGAVMQSLVLDSLIVVIAMLRRRHCAQADEQKRLDELETRNALANEVHDVVGHHLSAIALRAEGARSLLTPDDESVDEALVAIKSAATSALDEIRGVVQSLSAADQEMASPGPTLDDVERLCDNNLGGPLITLAVDTELADPSREVSRAAYRIVQEAITNSRRHAQAATTIDVSITSELDRLIIEVRDDGHKIEPPTTDGHGLRAMSSRTALLDGTFSAGPSPEGGWLVSASLPLGGTGDGNLVSPKPR